MLVYAFYGCGKTTLCEQNPDFYDFDFADFYKSLSPNGQSAPLRQIESAYIEKARELEQTHPVVLINLYYKGADLAVFQATYNDCLRRIAMRADSNFMPSQMEYRDTLTKFKEENVECILLDRDEYLSNIAGKIREGAELGRD